METYNIMEILSTKVIVQNRTSQGNSKKDTMNYLEQVNIVTRIEDSMAQRTPIRDMLTTQSTH